MFIFLVGEGFESLDLLEDFLFRFVDGANKFRMVAIFQHYLPLRL